MYFSMGDEVEYCCKLQYIIRATMCTTVLFEVENCKKYTRNVRHSCEYMLWDIMESNQDSWMFYACGPKTDTDNQRNVMYRM